MSPDDIQPYSLPPLQHILGSLAVLGIFALITWRLFRPRYVFLIHLASGGLNVKQGHVKPEFLEQLEDLRVRSGLSKGWVRGYQQGKQVRLTFSSDFPADCKQRVRNLWAIYK